MWARRPVAWLKSERVNSVVPPGPSTTRAPSGMPDSTPSTPAQVQHHPMARVVGALAHRAVGERLDDPGGGLQELRLADPRGDGADAPVVRHPPRGPAQLPEEPLDGVDLGRHGLQVGQRARGGGRRVVDAHDGGDVVEVAAGEETGLEQAPVPRCGRPREEQHQHVALGQAVADLPVPVGAGRQVGAGHEALDGRGETLERLLEGHRQRVVLVLVADEDVKAFVGQSRHLVPPAPPVGRAARWTLDSTNGAAGGRFPIAGQCYPDLPLYF